MNNCATQLFNTLFLVLNEEKIETLENTSAKFPSKFKNIKIIETENVNNDLKYFKCDIFSSLYKIVLKVTALIYSIEFLHHVGIFFICLLRDHDYLLYNRVILVIPKWLFKEPQKNPTL